MKLAFIATTLAALTVIFFYGLGDATMPLVCSFILAYLTFPLVRRLEKRGIPRGASVGFVFSALTITFLLVLVFAIPPIVADARIFIEQLPSNLAKALQNLEVQLSQLGIEVSLSISELTEWFSRSTGSTRTKILTGVGRSVAHLFSNSFNLILGFLNLALLPMFYVYVIQDYEKFKAQVYRIFPPRFHETLDRYLGKCVTVLSGYIRGQMMVALLLAIFYGVGLWSIGLRFGLVIGVLSGLISLIPYAGFAVGLSAALVMALAGGHGAPLIIGVVSVYGVVQALESFVITPKLVGDSVGLSAFATVLALIVWGNLLGFTGMLIAIPATAIIRDVTVDLIGMYEKDPFYRKESKA